MIWAALILVVALPAHSHALEFGNASVLQFHKNPSKDGFFVDRDLEGLQPSKTEAAKGFAAPDLTGQSYAQLLYVDRGSLGRDMLISATQANIVIAIAAGNGTLLWRRNLADPVPSTALPCGNIAPFVGVLSTPAIDEKSGTIVLSAKTSPDAGKTQVIARRPGVLWGLHVCTHQPPHATQRAHRVFYYLQKYLFYGLDVETGRPKPGYPVDVKAALAAKGIEFQTPAQLQRGGLLIQDGIAYAGYGGNSGDCEECTSLTTNFVLDALAHQLQSQILKISVPPGWLRVRYMFNCTPHGTRSIM